MFIWVLDTSLILCSVIIWHLYGSIADSSPLDTRRRFNVDTTSYDVTQRPIDDEATSRVYRDHSCFLYTEHKE